MSLFEISEPGRPPMIIGGSSFGVEDARYLQNEINDDIDHQGEVVSFVDRETLERTLPVSEVAVKQFVSSGAS